MRIMIRLVFLITSWLLVSVVVAFPQTPGFVGSQTCGTCHTSQLEAWTDSHHGWALREPSAENVLGDFDDAQFEHKGIKSRFFRDADRFLVETDGADGQLATFEIKYVVGVTPLQQYLVELDGGKLQALDIAWDTIEKRWYHLYPDENVSAGNGLHWSGSYKNWQARCAVCHQTDFSKSFDPKSRTYQSTWSELTVGCEACHGPGEAHVAWANKAEAGNLAQWPGVAADGLLQPETKDRQAIEENMCGPCHARREAHSPDSTLPTAPFGDHYGLSNLRGGLYFPDGQQDQEVYILGSFLQSKMHEKGVTCTNCHDPHSARLIAEGNAVCTQCHNEVGRDDFSTLKLKNYDSPAHHHHDADSSGAQCVSCHMPERDYMVVDGRRDHFFRIPDPVLSEKVGSPSACLGCHVDKTAVWAAASIDEWAPYRVAPDQGRGVLFSDVRQEGLDSGRIVALVALAQDLTKPAIERATALSEIADGVDAATLQGVTGLLSDDSDLVRAAAVRLWRAASPAERVLRLQPILADSISTVRIAAALELANVPPEALSEESRDDLQAALGELRASMLAKSDFPEAQMAIGGLALATSNWSAAQAAFAEATFLDPQLVQAWLTRARIAEALGNPNEAAAILASARIRNPDDIDIGYQLSQLLIQQGRFADAVPVLREIATAVPDDLGVRINLAFSLLQTGDLQAANIEIDHLKLVSPDRTEVLLLHGLRQVASNDLVGARETVRQITQQNPGIQLPPELAALARLP